jgi:hypothetical protein
VCIVLVNRARKIVLVCPCLLLLCVSCQHGEPAAQPGRSASQSLPVPAAAATEVPFAAAAATEVPRESLPRAVAGITLEMSTADAEAKLGALTCHANQGGFQVCSGAREVSDDVRRLELYVYHDRVISVSYEGLAPGNATEALNGLIERYGSPSLSGMRERDQSGRLHEIYGWKDDKSLYSIRFMWRNGDAGGSDLIAMITALWDRKGYEQWEAEMKPRGAPPAPDADPPREPT